jgi:arylsulfatase A-like enzyme
MILISNLLPKSSCRSWPRWLAGLAIIGLMGCGQEPAPKPNILLVLLDDVGINDLSQTTDGGSVTPNLDAFAKQGVQFTRHYTDAVCAPSRAALLTGRLAPEVGFHSYAAGLSPQLVTLPEQLQAAGYRTHMTGKWHLGNVYSSGRPENQGFDSWFGMLEAVDTGTAPGSDIKPTVTYHNPWLENEQGQRKQYQGHLTDLLTADATEFIRGQSEPWFLYLPFLAPHSPIEPAQRFAEKFEDSGTGAYLALLAQLDAAVAAVLDSVKQSGQWDNTLIVIASDNGGTSHHFPSNDPFVGKKGVFQEGGVRTPLMVYWQGQWQGGDKLDAIVSLIDIAPTLLDAAGVARAPGMRGKNLFKLAESAPTRPLYWYQETRETLQRGMLGPGGDWRWLSFHGGDNSLLNEAGFKRAEPNLYEKHPKRVARMEQQFDQWLWQATDVVLEQQQGEGHSWLYSGDDFRRSPVVATYSLGLAITPHTTGADLPEGLLAEQPGFLRLTTLEQSKARLWFDDQEIEFELPATDAACQSLVLTSFMSKARGRSSNRKGASEVALYLNGELIHQASWRNLKYATADPATALSISADPSLSLSTPPAAAPLISTRRYTATEVRDVVHPLLQQRCQAALN